MEDDGDDKDDTKRRTRNLSEKKRRDQFNLLVNELSTMVAINNRKMDKSSVLRSTISMLKNHNESTLRSRVHDIQEDWKPAFLSNEEFTYLVLEALEGFVLVFSTSGEICYVSESVASLLGHNPADLIGRSMFDLVYDEDRPYLFSILQNPGVPVVDPLQETPSEENEMQFQCHLRRGMLDFSEETAYELIEFIGHFRPKKETPGDQMTGFLPDPEGRLLFVCTCRLHTPHLIRDVSLMDTSRSEFTSRHSLEWKFLFLDHRAPPIIGYLPFEVLGTSGYDYYHFDDLEKVVSCHEALMQKGEMTSCYYRFLTKGQQWIWLQTRFYITYHQWNSKPEFVVCTHRVVSHADIQKSMKEECVEPPPVEEESCPMTVQPSEEGVASISPTYMSEASDAFNHTYQTLSQSASVKSASATSTCGTAGTAGTASAAVWAPAPPRFHGSDTASMSGDSRSSHRNKSIDQHVSPQQLMEETPLVQHQHMGAQYLEPGPYGGAVGGMLQLPMPVLVTPEQAQIQEQLQRKHELLQQMIVRQQEELRHVKEQLLLARLGILPSVMNVQPGYVNAAPNTAQPSQQFVYEPPTTRPAIAPYPQDNLPQ